MDNINILRKTILNLEMLKNERNKEFNEDINMLIKIIKRTLTSYETIVDITSLIHRIAAQNKFLLDIVTRHKFADITQFTQHLESMKLKMKEWLMLSKNKYLSGTVFKDIRGFLQQLQIVLGVFEKNNNFMHMVTKIYTIICEHLKCLKVKFDLFHAQGVQRSVQIPQNQCIRQAQSLILQSRFPTQIRAIKFSSLYGLQIDNSYLRNLMIQSNRNQLETVQSQLERNRFIAQQIEIYIKLFYFFVNRYKIRRKSRSQLYAKDPHFKNIRIKTTVNDRPCHNFNVSRGVRAISFKENGQDDVSKTKVALKINNVYVSGNEFDVYSDNSTHNIFKLNPNINKKKTVFLTRALRDPLISKQINGDSRQFMPI